MDTDSLFPLLDTCSDGEESYWSESSVAEVFMAGMPPPQSSLNRGSPVDPSIAARYAAVDRGRGGGAQLTPDQFRTAEDCLNTPITGTPPANITLGTACQVNLAESARLARVERELEARE